MCYIGTEVGKVASPLLAPLHVGDMLTEAIFPHSGGSGGCCGYFIQRSERRLHFCYHPPCTPLLLFIWFRAQIWSKYNQRPKQDKVQLSVLRWVGKVCFEASGDGHGGGADDGSLVVKGNLGRWFSGHIPMKSLGGSWMDQTLFCYGKSSNSSRPELAGSHKKLCATYFSFHNKELFFSVKYKVLEN